MSIRTYSELCKLRTFEERFEYLKLSGKVGEETFGFDRYLNQILYKTGRWRAIRDKIIIRDNGCDLGIEGRELRTRIIIRDNGCDFGIEGRELRTRIIIHHMNPLTKEDIKQNSSFLWNPEYLITVSHNTHNAIHYGDKSLLILDPVERTKNDTCPWKK